MADQDAGDPSRRLPVQLAAAGLGGLSLVIGCFGLIAGAWTSVGQFTPFGQHHGAIPSGALTGSVVHCFTYIAFGIVGLFAVRSCTLARWYLSGSGVAHLVLFMCGVIGFESVTNGDRLHLGLGIGMLLVGAVLGDHALRRGPASARGPAR